MTDLLTRLRLEGSALSIEAADALEAAGKDAERYRLMCELIDQGDSRIDAILGDAYNMGAGALDMFLDEQPRHIDRSQP